MQIAHAPTLAGLVPSIKMHMHETRFMIVWRRTADDRLYLYGSAVSEEDAVRCAASDFPLGELVQRIEYLPPERLAELRRQQEKDPLSATLEDLGLLKAH
jgi:hypothetical protein